MVDGSTDTGATGRGAGSRQRGGEARQQGLFATCRSRSAYLTSIGLPGPHCRQTPWRQLRVAHRVGDRGMAKKILDQPSVRSLVGESVAGGMPQHVGMDMDPASQLRPPSPECGDYVGR